jgi:hypothetical protein
MDMVWFKPKSPQIYANKTTKETGFCSYNQKKYSLKLNILQSYQDLCKQRQHEKFISGRVPFGVLKKKISPGNWLS